MGVHIISREQKKNASHAHRITIALPSHTDACYPQADMEGMDYGLNGASRGSKSAMRGFRGAEAFQ